MRLREISPDLYARTVLPLTAQLWAGRRSFDEYVEQTLAIARSPYGRRYYRTIGLYDGAMLVASFKRYERTVFHESRRLHTVAFGAVFTPAEYRGRGYASLMLGMALDRARSDGFDLAYLFSDIRPQFYTELGFRTLPSREMALRADELPAKRLGLSPLNPESWNGVRHCFELCQQRRRAGFVRTATVWDWIRLRMRHGSEHTVGNEANLIVRRGRGICAYVFGVRAPERDAYIVDEYGFADDDAAEIIPALLRAAAGDLRRVTGWVPPGAARLLLPRGTVRKRKTSVLMMAPLRSEGERMLRTIAEPASGEFCWATEHV